MQRLSGALMVLAGTALGGYMVLPAPNLSQGFQVSTQSDVPSSNRDAASRDAASLITSALAQQAKRAAVDASPADAPAETGAKRIFSAAQPLQAAPTVSSTWSTVVTSDAGTSSKFTSSKPGDSQSQTRLATDLQRELKRVGCYAGEITGTWTPSTKAAMSTFMERVNATLPVEQPDYILLTLVQGHAAIACGADCPSGQTMSSAGKCVPQAVVAQASRKLQREEERRALEQRKAQQQERLAEEQRAAEAQRIADARKSREAERIAAAALAKAAAEKLAAEKQASEKLAAQKAEAAKVATLTPPAPQPAVRTAAKPQQAAAVEAERLPWLEQSAPQSNGAPLATAAITPAAPREPLPGRMAIGGPRDLPLDPPPTSVAAVAPDVSHDKSAAPTVSTPSDDRLQVKIVPPPVKTEPVSPSETRAAPVMRPVERQAAIPGLPGSKSGVAVRGLPGSKSGVAVQGQPGSKSGIAVRGPLASPAPGKYKYTGPKVVRRPPPVVVVTPKYQYTASSSKVRRGQPRPGTMQYNVMHALGGIY